MQSDPLPSEKLSPPSVDSAGNSSGYSPKSRGSSGNNSTGDPFLVIAKQPPKYVYSNESFPVEVQLETPKTGSPLSHVFEEIELVAALHEVKTGRLCSGEAILMTEPSRILFPPAVTEGGTRTCRVNCMVRMDVIQRREGAALEVRFSPRQESEGSPPSSRHIARAATSPIHMVNYKINISMEDEWGKVWYKDEGGRDKCMEVFATIYDNLGAIRTGEQIPLLPILCYDTPEGSSPVRVSNQDILRTLGASKIVIDKDTGKARVRFRVEDVSKNHQGQDFVLEVAPDPKSKSFKDVAPGYTPPVNVRSKRNKRTRGGSASSGRSVERRGSPPPPSRPRYDDTRDLALQGADASRLHDAVKDIMNWAEDVVSGLYPLQWQVLGYQQHPDGSPDYSRPYHNMPNPNPCITRILSAYNESVRDDIRLLMTSVQQSAVSRPIDPTTFGPSVGQMRRESDDMFGMMRGASMQGSPMPMMGRGGMNQPPDAYWDKLPPPMQQQPGRIHARGQLPPMDHAAMGMFPPQYKHQGQVFMNRPGEGDMMVPGPPMPRRAMIGSGEMPLQGRSLRVDEESRESEVEYVLAKQYKALRTGERLGFPAYSVNKEILGFYREPQGKMGVGQFVPISNHRNDFGPLEIMQATEILVDAISNKSAAVHALKDWGSIASLLDHALVFDWSKDIGTEQSASDLSG